MEKDIFMMREKDLSYGRGYVYSLQYHIVWCTKYRRNVLTGGVNEDCKRILNEMAEEYSFAILACFLQALFTKSCRAFLQNVAIAFYRDLQASIANQ